MPQNGDVRLPTPEEQAQIDAQLPVMRQSARRLAFLGAAFFAGCAALAYAGKREDVGDVLVGLGLGWSSSSLLGWSHTPDGRPLDRLVKLAGSAAITSAALWRYKPRAARVALATAAVPGFFAVIPYA